MIAYLAPKRNLFLLLEFTHFLTGLDQRRGKVRQPPAVFGRIPTCRQQTGQGGCRAVNDTRIASKAKARPASFMGKVFAHFSKPGRRFVEDCIYGIQASRDTKLSSIARAIDDDIKPLCTEKRLSRNPSPVCSFRASRTSSISTTDSLPKKESGENHFPKRASAFVSRGAEHFRAQKTGKLQGWITVECIEQDFLFHIN